MISVICNVVHSTKWAVSNISFFSSEGKVGGSNN